jgi:hypothetical protein
MGFLREHRFRELPMGARAVSITEYRHAIREYCSSTGRSVVRIDECPLQEPDRGFHHLELECDKQPFLYVCCLLDGR